MTVWGYFAFILTVMIVRLVFGFSSKDNCTMSSTPRYRSISARLRATLNVDPLRYETVVKSGNLRGSPTFSRNSNTGSYPKLFNVSAGNNQTHTHCIHIIYCILSDEIKSLCVGRFCIKRFTADRYLDIFSIQPGDPRHHKII